MISCLIIDDEPQARKLLESMVSQLNGWSVVALCGNAVAAFDILQSNKVDVLFLDINMPVVSGIDLLKSLEHPPLVIFTTAYHQYAMEGYELNIVDYLLKPISMHRFLQAVGKVTERMSSGIPDTKAFMFLKHNNKLVKVNFSEINYVEGMQNFVRVHTDAVVYIVNQTMKSIEALLPAAEFIRVHKSYIISIKAVKAVFGNTVEMAGIQVPIGNNYKEAFMKYIEG
jgi:DNA-binding LytR/AlgR family response regulator